MEISRRDSIRLLMGGAGSLAAGHFMPSVAEAAGVSGPKRIIFFMQNHGFDLKTCIPVGMTGSGSLAKAKLPEPIAPLEPYKERLHIISGLHGKHALPFHSAFFGALGGYRGGRGVAPGGPTIDHVVSNALPKTILPHLCIGMDSLDKMLAKPTVATLSARGAGKPIFMQSNPNALYQMLYGGISTGQFRKQHEARTQAFEQVERLAVAKGQSVPSPDLGRFGQYVKGLKDTNELRDRLAGMSDHLRKFVPLVDDRYSKPKFETDWHDVLLDLGISALKAGVTNTLTIGSGRGDIFGAWQGLAVKETGHSLGHMKQADNPIWTKIRQYNCRMLVKIIEELEKVPEGSGCMMDNTLIVYTSNNASSHHGTGVNWPVILLGNFNGRFKSGKFTQLSRKRPINAFYATIMHTVTGKPIERFNMSEQVAKQFDSGIGPIKELLA